MTTPATSTPADAPAADANYFQECFGASYELVAGLDRFTASDPSTIRRVVDDAKQKHPEAADVIAALVFFTAIDRDRNRRLLAELRTRRPTPPAVPSPADARAAMERAAADSAIQAHYARVAAEDAAPGPGHPGAESLCVGRCDPGEHRRCYACAFDLAGREAHFDEQGNAWCVTCAQASRQPVAPRAAEAGERLAAVLARVVERAPCGSHKYVMAAYQLGHRHARAVISEEMRDLAAGDGAALPARLRAGEGE